MRKPTNQISKIATNEYYARNRAWICEKRKDSYDSVYQKKRCKDYRRRNPEQGKRYRKRNRVRIAEYKIAYRDMKRRS